MMAVGTLQIQIPIRAFWWLKKIAIRQGCSIEKLSERWLLEKLNGTPDVDLSRSPSMEE